MLFYIENAYRVNLCLYTYCMCDNIIVREILININWLPNLNQSNVAFEVVNSMSYYKFSRGYKTKSNLTIDWIQKITGRYTHKRTNQKNGIYHDAPSEDYYFYIIKEKGESSFLSYIPCGGINLKMLYFRT